MYYHKRDRDELIAELADRFPKTFFVDPKQRRPLKANIVDDLQKEDVLDHDQRIQAVDWYMSPWAYQYSLFAGNERIDLSGKVVGKVTLPEQKEALKRIAAQKQEQKEKRLPLGNKVNGADHVIVKTKPPALPTPTTSVHPLLPQLTDMTAAINVVRTLLSENQFEALRPTLAAAAIKEIIARAETMLRTVNPD